MAPHIITVPDPDWNPRAIHRTAGAEMVVRCQVTSLGALALSPSTIVFGIHA